MRNILIFLMYVIMCCKLKKVRIGRSVRIEFSRVVPNGQFQLLKQFSFECSVVCLNNENKNKIKTKLNSECQETFDYQWMFIKYLCVQK